MGSVASSMCTVGAALTSTRRPGAAPCKLGSSGDEIVQMARDLLRAASGEEGQHLGVIWDAEPTARLGARRHVHRAVEQRMSNECGVDAIVSQQRLFERE